MAVRSDPEAFWSRGTHKTDSGRVQPGSTFPRISTGQGSPEFWHQTRSYLEDLHHFIAEMIDDLHGDAARPRLIERARSVAVQRRPRLFVDFRLEGGLQSFIGIVSAEEVGLAHKEALLVVVGVHEPAGDSLGSVAAHFAGSGVKHIDAYDFHLNLAVLRFQDLNVWFAEDDEQVSLARVLQFIGHVQVGVHACL